MEISKTEGASGIKEINLDTCYDSKFLGEFSAVLP